MIIYDYSGEPLCHQKIVPGNTATALSADCIQYVRKRLDFDDGDTELTVGSWIVGATNGAIAKIVEVNADTSTWTNNTGYLILDSLNGIAFQNDEEIKQAGAATAANVNGLLKYWDRDYPYKGMMAKSILVSVYAQTALVNCFIGGGIPDQTALVGVPMVANSSIRINDINAIKNFKVIDYVSGSASTVQVTFYF